jgi:hypothetical protein
MSKLKCVFVKQQKPSQKIALPHATLSEGEGLRPPISDFKEFYTFYSNNNVFL